MDPSLAAGRRTMVLRRIGVLSSARMYGAILAAFGFLLGCIFALAAMIGASVAPEEGGAFLGAMFGVGAIVLAPLFYGIFGFVSGAITAALYNAFAAAVGGVSLELE